MRHHCDVLIIGGGIIGCAIAYYTSKSERDVTVIEKGEFVSGTSSRCDGNILAIDKDPGFDSQMSLVSQKLVDELSRELKQPLIIERLEASLSVKQKKKWKPHKNGSTVRRRPVCRSGCWIVRTSAKIQSILLMIY